MNTQYTSNTLNGNAGHFSSSDAQAAHSAGRDKSEVTQQTQAPSPQQKRQRYASATLTPPVDVVEDSGGITLYADLPGVPKENLKLQVEADTLTIEAESALVVPEGLQSSHTEVGFARFHRVFTLSKELDTNNVSAELTQGVLKLRIPKAAHAQPRRIAITAA